MAQHERGDTLIEVMIGAMLLLVVAAGVITGLTVFGHESASQRQRSQADALAQQAEGQLRGEELSQLQTLIAAGSTGSASTVTQNGTTYTITNTAQYVAAGGTSSSCTASSSGNADYIKTMSAVTWSGSIAAHPVVEEGVIAATSGSSLVVQVLDENADPVADIAITASGTDASTSGTNETLETDANGCAVFYGLTVGTYTVSAQGPSGQNYIDPTGNANPSLNETLLAGQTTNASFEMAQAGTLNANFVAVAPNGAQTPVSSYGGNGSTAWMLQNNNMTPTTANESSTPATGLFPFANQYGAFAGSCTSDNLLTSPVTVPAGSSASVSLLLPTLSLVAMTSGKTSSATSTLSAATFTDTGCGTSYPALALSQTNLLSSAVASNPSPSEALPSGTYSACAQWLVANPITTTTHSTITSTATGSYTTTTTTTTTTHGFPNTTHTLTSTTTVTTHSTTTSTSTVTSTTTTTNTSAASTNSITNTTSTTSAVTLSEAAAISGHC